MIFGENEIILIDIKIDVMKWFILNFDVCKLIRILDNVLK